MTDAAALDRGIARGIAVFRWLALGWAGAGLAFEWDHLERPVLAVSGLALATLVTVAATLLLASGGAAVFSPSFQAVELAVGASLLVLDGWVYTSAREQSLPWAWPAAGIIAIAVTRGSRWGLGAAGVCAAASFAGESALHDSTDWSVTAASKSALYALAALGAGAVTTRLREAEREISTARAREEMARTLHDGVLQTLAVIQRRSGDDELQELAREQERELRGYLFGQAASPASLAGALRSAGDAVARRHGIEPQLVLAADLPDVSTATTTALAGAVGEALTNAAKHSGSRHIVVFAEPTDVRGQVFCSIRDDGVGFLLDEVHEGEGLRRSIRARIADVGGRVEIESRPGRGTEVSGVGDLTTVRVVVADDHPIWRTGVRTDLGDNFHVVAEAADAARAVEQIRAHRPDVVLCDLHMPEGGGLRVARECGAETKVVILTVSESERDLLDAVAAGALGYLLKSTPPQDLRNALWKAAQGEPVFSPSLASLVLTEFRRLKKTDQSAEGLSAREREVLQLVARGLSYKDIGEQLFISPKTVENHTRNILDKLHLSRKNELMRYALEHGIE